MNNYSLFCCLKEENNIWEIIQGITNILISLLTLFLTYYVFIYQKKKDKSDKENSIQQQSKNNKLQWFKELIIQPKMNEVFDYFEKIKTLKNDINSNELSMDQRQDLIERIKQYQSDFRKSFLEIVQNVNSSLYNDLLKHIDDLTDKLTEVISNDELKLCHEKTYDREIQKPIDKTYNNFMASIFNFEG